MEPGRSHWRRVRADHEVPVDEPVHDESIVGELSLPTGNTSSSSSSGGKIYCRVKHPHLPCGPWVMLVPAGSEYSWGSSEIASPDEFGSSGFGPDGLAGSVSPHHLPEREAGWDTGEGIIISPIPSVRDGHHDSEASTDAYSESSVAPSRDDRSTLGE
eukprot:GHVU01185504.1.p1 GENE.GHVU01185504.1~~GHVU01185504.1.p1  ORF type:complete len:158 (-),score=2.63 GHVU01185504.1:789-1262(-)